ncbi:MAG TPA: pitrilysin family protein [Vicinamibacterales bacterium]|nr:pitrilysin family protein [Vicinamibacterales bacterium]
MAVDRSALPPLGDLPPFHFPRIDKRSLPSGLRVWTVEHRAVPLLSVLVLVRRGAAADPRGQEGLAAIVGDLLDEGCGALDALALHEALGRIGAQLDTEVGADATLLGLTLLSRFADRGVALLADMVREPRLDVRDFERVRDLRLNRLLQIRDLPPALADRAFTQLVYGGHPYGHLSIGSEAALRALSLASVKAFHAGAYVPANVTVIAAGSGSHDDLAALVERAFGDWTPGAGSAANEGAVLAVPPVPATRLGVLHKPGAAQSELRIGHMSIARNHPDYLRLLVLNMVLGGQFVSRINMNLREDKGYTYGVRTGFDARRGPGPFLLQASVQSEATAEAIRESIGEIAAIRGDRPVTRVELETGRAALTRGYPRNFETAEQVARAAAQMALHDLPDDYYTTFVPSVLAIDEQAVTAAADRHLDPSRLLTIIVGDRDRIGPALTPLALGEPFDLGVPA